MTGLRGGCTGCRGADGALPKASKIQKERHLLSADVSLSRRDGQNRYFKISKRYRRPTPPAFWPAAPLRRTSVLPQAKPWRRANSLRPSIETESALIYGPAKAAAQHEPNRSPAKRVRFGEDEQGSGRRIHARRKRRTMDFARTILPGQIKSRGVQPCGERSIDNERKVEGIIQGYGLRFFIDRSGTP